MKTLSGIRELKGPVSASVVTVGNFDGVHLGHQQIMAIGREKAKKLSAQLVVFTFRPHPTTVLRPELGVQLLTTYPERAELIEKQGAEILIEEPFSRDFSSTRADEFFHQNLIRGLNAKAIVVGYDFAFGKGRDGNLDRLKDLCDESGVELVVAPAFRPDGQEVVSSSRVRDCLSESQMEEARRLLGYSFFYRGLVMRGEGRGRQLGFPTANLKIEAKTSIPFGVYATFTQVDAHVVYPSVTNVGVRPTFTDDGEGELDALVETHLLDQDIDLYGRTLEVRFEKYIRAERRFAGREELIAQIRQDADAARQWLPSASTRK